MNIHQTAAHAQFLQSIGWITVQQNQVFAFIRPLPLVHIALMKLQRVHYADIDWEWVAALERKHLVYQTVIELNDTFSHIPPSHQELRSYGFTPAADFMLNTKTRIIDLSCPQAALLADMKPKTRYNINLAKRHHLQVHHWSCRQIVSDPNLFNQIYTLLKTNADRIHMLLLPKSWIKHQYAAYGDQGFVIGITEPDASTLLSVATFYLSQDTCSYNLNGSTARGRTLMAPTLALWSGIVTAQEQQYKWFDFDGIFDERFPQNQQKFKGFGRFKAGFGGSEVYFHPMYKKWRNPFK